MKSTSVIANFAALGVGAQEKLGVGPLGPTLSYGL